MVDCGQVSGGWMSLPKFVKLLSQLIDDRMILPKLAVVYDASLLPPAWG